MFHNNKANRENLEAEKEKKRLFNKHRHELKLLEVLREYFTGCLFDLERMETC